ncbi:DNA repair protein RecN [Taibaiella soli]|uniref:DNA repair protein RecN n=1 Tax=Taibaiella soli TaxID=1649169 RepID=A0A2W2BCN3_9BACT|nr:DNA repair protein RecN [Taibaiella soli]PZF71426.1 DNA repair protein RecN [Taibaiella soli]
MLQKLIIRNYAIIDHLTVTPDAHLNIVTGETGAGKSIILGALSLILGERADTSVLINKDEKCVVEGHFDVRNNDTFQKALREAELDEESQCIIRREISASGKSRAFINDTPVNLQTLNRISSLLVDLHQQFDHLALEDDNFQMDVLDAVAQNSALLKDYQQLYRQYRKISQQLTESISKQAQFQKEADYKQFLLDELAQMNFVEDELENAAQQMKQMSHAERIHSVLQSGRYSLEEGEQPLINELKRVSQQLQSITDVMPEVNAVSERLTSVWAELKDIAGELETLEGHVDIDPQQMQELQERLDAGYKMLKKHGVQTTNELLALQATLSNELQATLDLNDTIEKLAKEQGVVYKQLETAAEKLSRQRKAIAPEISKEVNKLLALVGMPNAQFKIELQPLKAPVLLGMDEVQFLLDANKSGQFLPIHKAASGGEMSRIMLSIKSLTAKAMHLPTLIFDEVDTGISGEAARQVGVLLRDLAQYHQVICITHQPQVAAKGSRHFYVYKESGKDQRITTQVRELKPDERVLAIARMIGGEQPSDAALQNARELVN